MAKVALPINTSLSSIYLLWWALSNTSDEITAYYTHLPTRKITQRFAIAPTVENKNKVDSIVSILKTIRDFDYEVLTIENYNPKWTSIQNFEIIEKVKSVGTFDKIWFDDMLEMEGQTHKDVRKATAKIALGLTVEYPVSNISLLEATTSLSSGLLSLSSDKFIDARKNMLATGKTASEISALELSIYDESHPRYGVESDGYWFIDNDPYFGTILEKDFELSFAKNYPYYTYLIRD